MKWGPTWCLAVVLVCSGGLLVRPGKAADAPDAAKPPDAEAEAVALVEELYGSQIAHVTQTKTGEDDAELAVRLLGAACTAGDREVLSRVEGGGRSESMAHARPRRGQGLPGSFRAGASLEGSAIRRRVSPDGNGHLDAHHLRQATERSELPHGPAGHGPIRAHSVPTDPRWCAAGEPLRGLRVALTSAAGPCVGFSAHAPGPHSPAARSPRIATRRSDAPLQNGYNSF